MCATVWVARSDDEDDDVEVGNQGDLVRELLGGDSGRLHWYGTHLFSVPMYAPRHCLCPVDLESTFQGAGVSYFPDGFPGDYRAVAP